MKRITVFTPAYNRAHTLTRLYESLLNQPCKDFVWLIIDDGSTDNTAELIRGFVEKDNGFEIKYVYKENGGMHTAHNTAYELIDTELNVCIDSDDVLADNAIEKILQHWDAVKHRGYAGIIGLNTDLSGKIIGKGFGGITETTLKGYYANGGSGDKKLVYRTDIIKKYPPYPIFNNEKYLALAYKYRLIDNDYKLSVLSDVLCNVEYQADGSTNNIFNQYINSPRGFAFWRKVCMVYPTKPSRVFMECIHYVSSSIFAKNKAFITESPRKALTVIAIPFGALLTLYIKLKAK